MAEGMPDLPLSPPAWRDAVAKFRLGCGGDLAARDHEFLEQHPTADIITHENGALVGAFYMAPGWSHATDAVSIFSALHETESTRSKEDADGA